MRLHRMIATMKVPNYRRNFKEEENLRWLVRNLGKENKKHPYFEIVKEELEEKLKNFERLNGV